MSNQTVVKSITDPKEMVEFIKQNRNKFDLSDISKLDAVIEHIENGGKFKHSDYAPIGFVRTVDDNYDILIHTCYRPDNDNYIYKGDAAHTHALCLHSCFENHGIRENNELLTYLTFTNCKGQLIVKSHSKAGVLHYLAVSREDSNLYYEYVREVEVAVEEQLTEQ